MCIRVKDLAEKLPRIPIPVAGQLVRGLTNPTLAEVSQLAFTNRILEEALIARLQGQPVAPSVLSEPNITSQEIPRIIEDIKPARKRSEKQMINDSILSDSFEAVNKRARKKDGSFKKGWDQRRVASIAWKECTKERKRLGLCD